MSLAFEQGTYIGRITNWGLSKAKTGTPQFFVSFQPLGRIDQSRPDDMNNLIPCADFERTVFRAITEKTVEYFAKDLTQLGYPHSTFDYLDREHPQAHDFDGQEIRVLCKHDSYMGKEKEKWEFAWSGDGFTPTSIDRTGVKELNAMFGKHLKKGPAATSRPAPTKPTNGKSPKAAETEKQAEEVF